MRSSRSSPYVFAAAVLAVIIGFHPLARSARYIVEDISYTFDPTPERAFAIGEAHFTATRPNDYDFDRAATFFRLAEVGNSRIPFLQHELARAAFLQGRYGDALSHINAQINLSNGQYPNSFYIRGLIEGYMGRYDEAAADYNHFLEAAPTNWAAMNDYAWVLMKGDRYQAAADVTEEGLRLYPDNPWLLNSRATALYELGRYNEAYSLVQRADRDLRGVTQTDWLTAYPGNDPAVAGDGLTAFRYAIEKNMHMIAAKVATSTLE